MKLRTRAGFVTIDGVASSSLCSSLSLTLSADFGNPWMHDHAESVYSSGLK